MYHQNQIPELFWLLDYIDPVEARKRASLDKLHSDICQHSAFGERGSFVSTFFSPRPPWGSRGWGGPFPWKVAPLPEETWQHRAELCSWTWALSTDSLFLELQIFFYVCSIRQPPFFFLGGVGVWLVHWAVRGPISDPAVCQCISSLRRSRGQRVI